MLSDISGSVTEFRLAVDVKYGIDIVLLVKLVEALVVFKSLVSVTVALLALSFDFFLQDAPIGDQDR